MDPTITKKFAEMVKLLSDSLTKKDFEKAFATLYHQVSQLKDKNKEEFAKMYGELRGFSEKLSKDTTSDVTKLKLEVDRVVSKALTAIEKKLAKVKDGKDGRDGSPGLNGRDGKDGKDGSPDTGDEIIQKINRGTRIISKKAVEGLEALEDKVDEVGQRGTSRSGWGAHPLMIQGLGVIIDKNTRTINFKGTAVSSVTRTKDGVVNVTIDSGGTAGTVVSEEIPTDSGDHTNFTLAHTPIAGSFRLYRGGARQASIGVTPDYTRTGTALTLTVPLNTADGEVLFADYSY